MQFIKIDKNLKKDLTPRELMLYGMIAAYLSIPGFEATHGGFKSFLREQTNNGRVVFNAAWKGLKDKGYLKMIRIPFDRNKFYYRYELRRQAEPDTLSAVCMTVGDGRRYLAKKLPLYTEPHRDYYAVDRQMLLSPVLSLDEKYLSLILQDQMDLFEKALLKDHHGEELPYLKKEHIRRASGFHSCRFERVWKSLKQHEVLHAARFFDRQHGVTRVEYSLAHTYPHTQIDPRPNPGKEALSSPPVRRSIVDTQPHVPSINLDYKTIAAVVKENINYDGMLRWCGVYQADGFWYSKGQLDKVVDRMVSAICNKQPTVRLNGVEMPTEVVRERMLELHNGHVLSALRGIWSVTGEGYEIRNCRAYLLTALYNATED